MDQLYRQIQIGEYTVEVQLKEVAVRGGNTAIKAFARIIK